MAGMDLDFEDELFDEDELEEEWEALDRRLFGTEQEFAPSGKCARPYMLECRLPTVFPKRGKCTTVSGPTSWCTKGLWYKPKFGDTLNGVARRTLQAAGLRGTVRTVDYRDQISKHASNHKYHSTTGSGRATRQFLLRWDVETERRGGRIVRQYIVFDRSGGDYGLMYLPPIYVGLSGKFCDFRKVVAAKPLCS